MFDGPRQRYARTQQVCPARAAGKRLLAQQAHSNAHLLEDCVLGPHVRCQLREPRVEQTPAVVVDAGMSVWSGSTVDTKSRTSIASPVHARHACAATVLSPTSARLPAGMTGQARVVQGQRRSEGHRQQRTGGNDVRAPCNTKCKPAVKTFRTISCPSF